MGLKMRMLNVRTGTKCEACRRGRFHKQLTFCINLQSFAKRTLSFLTLFAKVWFLVLFTVQEILIGCALTRNTIKDGFHLLSETGTAVNVMWKALKVKPARLPAGDAVFLPLRTLSSSGWRREKKKKDYCTSKSGSITVNSKEAVNSASTWANLAPTLHWIHQLMYW